ncbi:TetR family transcriptional regulator [Streptomyces sp. A7024]|uniref:TetR family transcriptional regulator n=1 Tax=Streptomyces coryli TaxID=1128680 RepID=A0A6G4U9M5_9ACTN|nr:TetR/AcrR family transcriptional regulator [Streptomyces coryli]NGN68712.1 TetR family transcriptional regulator [Streptomyces coryli]
MDSTTTPGLREQKKQETRQLISDRATELFIEHGFEETKISDIADAARVAKKTVTNYFPRKEDLALDHADAFIAGLARTVAERAEGESALAALRRVFLAGVERRDPVIGFAGPEFTRMIAASPTLISRLRELHERREYALCEALAAETGADPDDITPRVAAAQLAAVHRLLFQDLVRLNIAGVGNDAIAAEVGPAAERAFDLLEPSLGGYAVRG